MKKTNIGNLILALSKKNDSVSLEWTGESSEIDQTKELNLALDEILKEIDSELLIRFNDLEFMSSSTISSIILFIKKLDQKEINTTITYNKESEWQKSCFRAMTAISTILKHITVIEN